MNSIDADSDLGAENRFYGNLISMMCYQRGTWVAGPIAYQYIDVAQSMDVWQLAQNELDSAEHDDEFLEGDVCGRMVERVDRLHSTAQAPHQDS